VEYAVTLLNLLRHTIRQTHRGNGVGVLFSGGLDSSVIAALCLEHSDATLYTVGTEGAHDLAIAEKTALEMGWTWHGIVLETRDVIDALLPLGRIIGTGSLLPLSYEMPLFLVAGRAKEPDLFTGQGADELFGGYSRYLRMDSRELLTCMSRDVRALVETGSETDRAIARHFGKEVHHPFLDPSIIDFGSRLPHEQRINEGERKVVLRQVARMLGLGETAERAKKAAQYGSGIMKAMKTEARRRKLGVSGLIASLQAEEERS
jgi:asparagine synthase (glutamine-hydrolysing)